MTSFRKTPLLLAALFLGLCLAGINLGEVPAVLEKAARICLSCIGIG
jgi:hypothetical protein